MELKKFNVRELSSGEMKETNGGLAFFVGVLILAGITFLFTAVVTAVKCDCNEVAE